MATFGQLRATIFREAGVRDQAEFVEFDLAYRKFNQGINKAECSLGLLAECFESSSLPLCDMDLLSEEDIADWLERFRKIKRR